MWWARIGLVLLAMVLGACGTHDTGQVTLPDVTTDDGSANPADAPGGGDGTSGPLDIRPRPDGSDRADHGAAPDVASDLSDLAPLDLNPTDGTADTVDTPDLAGDGEVVGDIWVDTGPADLDGDQVPDDEDNCPTTPNPGQENMDGDKQGDLCDPDMDGDFEVNAADNCPQHYNPDQEDVDGDGLGDPCDTDADGDGLVNEQDSCPLDPNPGQEDADQDGVGDPCDPDDDNDDIPDIVDEAPDDPNWPGLATDGQVYAHTSGALYKWDPQAGLVTSVGNFGWPQGSDSMTDIAIDYEGHLFGVSFNKLYRCSAISAECIYLADLPTSFNGLTIVPVNTVTPGKEAIIGIGNNGSWNHVEVQGNQATISQLGSYGGGYTSSGDAYSIEGVGTFAAVNKPGVASDVLVQVDPATGAVLNEYGTLDGYSSIFGLASDGELTYAFDDSGTILAIDLDTGIVEVALPANQAPSWWGAGVTTRYFD